MVSLKLFCTIHLGDKINGIFKIVLLPFIKVIKLIVSLKLFHTIHLGHKINGMFKIVFNTIYLGHKWYL